MKSLILAMVAGVVLSGGVAFADCESDCDSTFQTCLNLCRQTTKEDSPEAATCVEHCLHGVSGCVKRCAEKEKKSENSGTVMLAYVPTASTFALPFTTELANSCIEKGLTCILTGTPCCSPYECKGKFPNTYCQE